ncbi:MAG: c-type cytochrome [Deltaproteobacteria bacterium]|nr:c-type cytochrome [Deltaproteobacteria bacterium]
MSPTRNQNHRAPTAALLLLAALALGCRSNPIFRTARVHSAVPRDPLPPDARAEPAPAMGTPPAALPHPVTGAVALAEAATLGNDAPRLYARFCSLCHGPEGKGYAADNAPSLVSSTFLESATPEFLAASIAQGRPGTAMGAYARAVGGPLLPAQVDALVTWLRRNAPPRISEPAVPPGGNMARGQAFFALKCQKCHGTPAQRATAVHLFNPLLLQQASDDYLVHAIRQGRPGTDMVAWRETLEPLQIADILAYLRSVAQPVAAVATPPAPPPALPWTESPVIHPKGKPADFKLKDGRLVKPEDVHRALQAKRRIVILDARPPSDWLRLHIPGSQSLPYYDMANLDKVPNDGTWVIAYCACPHHASGAVVDELRKRGYAHTAVMDEGIFAYQHKGFEVVVSKDNLPSAAPPPPPALQHGPLPLGPRP